MLRTEERTTRLLRLFVAFVASFNSAGITGNVFSTSKSALFAHLGERKVSYCPTVFSSDAVQPVLPFQVN